MTLIVAVAFPDAVVLIADGHHANEVKIKTDRAQKLFLLSDQIAVGVGVWLAG